MFLILCGILALLPLQSSKGMKLKFVSSEFVFQKGELAVTCFDTYEEKQLEADSGSLTVPMIKTSLGPVPLTRSSVELQISQPTKCIAVLTMVTAIRTRDEREFEIPHIPLGEFKVDASSLERGDIEVRIDPRGILRVLVLDKDQNRVANKLVAFDNGDDLLEIETNKSGEILVMALSSSYLISVRGDRDTWIRVELPPSDQEVGIILQTQ